MHKLTFLLFFAAAIPASAQRVSFGVKAGVPVTEATPDDNPPYTMVDTGRWTVGPTAEFRLFRGFSFEFDALYRAFRQENTVVAVLPPGTTVISISNTAFYAPSQQNAKEWDFPLLLKYRFHAGSLRPFVDGGEVFAHQTPAPLRPPLATLSQPP